VRAYSQLYLICHGTTLCKSITLVDIARHSEASNGLISNSQFQVSIPLCRLKIIDFDFSMRTMGCSLDEYRSHPAHPDQPDQYHDDMDIIRHARQIIINPFAAPNHRTNSELTALTDMSGYHSFGSKPKLYERRKTPSCPNLLSGRTGIDVPIPNKIPHIYSMKSRKDLIESLKSGLSKDVLAKLQRLENRLQQRKHKIYPISQFNLLQSCLLTNELQETNACL
jgi:hypothetical protein